MTRAAGEKRVDLEALRARIDRIHACRELLPPPGPEATEELVGYCRALADELERARAERGET